VALTLGDRPGETTHWTGRVMAQAAGVSLTSVQRTRWSVPVTRPGQKIVLFSRTPELAGECSP
jgi:hypothetical protein